MRIDAKHTIFRSTRFVLPLEKARIVAERHAEGHTRQVRVSFSLFINVDHPLFLSLVAEAAKQHPPRVLDTNWSRSLLLEAHSHKDRTALQLQDLHKRSYSDQEIESILKRLAMKLEDREAKLLATQPDLEDPNHAAR